MVQVWNLSKMGDGHPNPIGQGGSIPMIYLEFACLILFGAWNKQQNLLNGGLMVVYHGTKRNITLNKSQSV